MLFGDTFLQSFSDMINKTRKLEHMSNLYANDDCLQQPAYRLNVKNLVSNISRLINYNLRLKHFGTLLR